MLSPTCPGKAASFKNSGRFIAIQAIKVDPITLPAEFG